MSEISLKQENLLNQNLKDDPDCLIQTHAAHILQSENFLRTENFIQHGTTSCRMHCISVARCSLAIAAKLHLPHDTVSLVRGALLHDFFLYDWHVKQPDMRGLHGYTHPKAAYAKASAEFSLNRIERDIILRHMFPLTIVPPRSVEAWLVCLSDKICSILEIFRNRPATASSNPIMGYGAMGQPDKPPRSDAVPHP